MCGFVFAPAFALLLVTAHVVQRQQRETETVRKRWNQPGSALPETTCIDTSTLVHTNKVSTRTYTPHHTTPHQRGTPT
jgi:hypothetical protein